MLNKFYFILKMKMLIRFISLFKNTSCIKQIDNKVKSQIKTEDKLRYITDTNLSKKKFFDF